MGIIIVNVTKSLLGSYSLGNDTTTQRECDPSNILPRLHVDVLCHVSLVIRHQYPDKQSKTNHEYALRKNEQILIKELLTFRGGWHILKYCKVMNH